MRVRRTGRLVGFSGLLNGSLASHPAKVEAVRKAIEQGFQGAASGAPAKSAKDTKSTKDTKDSAKTAKDSKDSKAKKKGSR